MARTAITLIRRHGSEKFEMVAGPDSPLFNHQEAVKESMRSTEHPEIAEVQYWESGQGLVKRRKFDDSRAAEKAAAEKAAAEKAAAEKAAAEKAAAEKAAAEKLAADAASQPSDITDPVSSEASPEDTTAAEGELTAEAPAPTPPEPVKPPAPVASSVQNKPAPKKQASNRR